MNSIVREAFHNAQDKYGGTLPAGRRIERAVSGCAVSRAGQTTAVDMASLGAHAHAVTRNAQGARQDRRVDGRRQGADQEEGHLRPAAPEGKFFIAGEEQVYDPDNLPQAPPSSRCRKGSKQHFGNQLVFTNAKDAEAFRNSQPGYTRLTFRHVDPKTGKRVPASFGEADPSVPGGIRTAKKEFIVTVQNKLMEMSDNEGELQKRREELTKAGHAGVGGSTVRCGFTAGGRADIHRRRSQRLLKNVGQTTAGQTPVGQQVLHDAILDSHVRQLTSPGHLQRRLKRRNVKGEVSSTFKALQAYNRSIGNHLANLEIQQAISKAAHEGAGFHRPGQLQPLRQGDSRVTQDRQSQLNEIVDRIRNVKNETTESGCQRILNHVRNYRRAALPRLAALRTSCRASSSTPALFRCSPSTASPAMRRRASCTGR